MGEKSSNWSTFGTAVVLGVGVAGGIMYRKVFPVSRTAGNLVERAKRLEELRMKGLGKTHKMVCVVRMDLGMRKGKIASQCSHAVLKCYKDGMNKDMENVNLWEAGGKVMEILKTEGKENTLFEMERKAKELNIITTVIADAGWTQVDRGTNTVLGMGPAPASEIDKVAGHLKAL